MATTLRFRRYTTAELASLTGAEGELFVDLNKDTVVVQDGSTAGGFPLQNELVSGTNIKTINSTSLLGSGNIEVVEDFSAVAEDILPLFTEVYDIGAIDNRWYDVFISNSLDINGSTFTADSATITTTSDMVVGSLLVDNLLLSDNLITPDNTTIRQYSGDQGWVTVNGNLDVDGDLLQLPVAQTLDSVPPLTTGLEGSIRFNKDTSSFEGYDGTAWGSLGGVSTDSNGNATVDANLTVTGEITADTITANTIDATPAPQTVLPTSLSGISSNGLNGQVIASNGAGGFSYKNVLTPVWTAFTPSFSWTGSGAIPAGSVSWSIGRYFEIGDGTFIYINAAFFGHAASGDLTISTPTSITNVSGAHHPASIYYTGVPTAVIGESTIERAGTTSFYPYRKSIGTYGSNRFSYADTENNGSFRIVMTAWYY